MGGELFSERRHFESKECILRSANSPPHWEHCFRFLCGDEELSPLAALGCHVSVDSSDEETGNDTNERASSSLALPSDEKEDRWRRKDP